MRKTKVSCNNHLYLEPQTIYILSVKKGHMDKIFKLYAITSISYMWQKHVFFFSIEAYKG